MRMNTLCAAVAAGLLAMAGTSFAQTTTSPSDRSVTTPSQNVSPSAPRVSGDNSGVLPSENCMHLTGAEKATCEQRNARGPGRASTGSSSAPVITGGSPNAPVSDALPSERCESLTGFEKETCEARNARGARTSAGSSTAPATTGGSAAAGSPVSGALPSERCEHLTGFEKEKCEDRNARGARGGSSGTPGSTGTTTTPGGR